MALLQNEKYIRLLEEGSYEIYNTQSDREANKKAPSIDDIKKKYHELLFELKSYFYDAMNVPKLALEKYNLQLPPKYVDGLEDQFDWKQISSFFFVESADPKYNKVKSNYYHQVLDERNLFLSSVYNDSISFEEFSKMDFSVITEYFPDIYLTKIRPVEIGQIPLLARDTIAEEYNEAKRIHIFGDTEDV